MKRPKSPQTRKTPSSDIGLTDNHRINLPQGSKIGTIAHELLHALGLHHEHVRFDRDSYVHVRDRLIKKGNTYKYIKKFNDVPVAPQRFLSFAVLWPSVALHSEIITNANLPFRSIRSLT